MTYAEGPSLVGKHAFTTGQIALRSFEKVLSPSTMKIGVEDGIGCYPDKLPEDEQTKADIPDQFRHELATAYNLKGRGLVILTACSHRGVVNTIKQAQAVSGVTKVHAVIGGFHLAPYATITCARRSQRSRRWMSITSSRCTALARCSTNSRSPRCRPSCCAPTQEPALCSRVTLRSMPRIGRMTALGLATRCLSSKGF